MKRFPRRRLGGAVLVLTLSSLLGGCTGTSFEGGESEGRSDSTEDDFTSAKATLLDFTFDGELTATSPEAAATKIRGQLLFTVGQLNAFGSGPRLNAVTLSQLKTSPASAGLYRITYRAKLPVAWNIGHAVPSTFRVVLPRRVDDEGKTTFFANWGLACTEADGHQVTAANMWYHFRPGSPSCKANASEFVSSTATVTKSPENAVGARYPEYHRIWEDGVLGVVAVFGKYEYGALDGGDAGIAAYSEFVAAVRAMFPDATTVPANLPDLVDVETTDVSFSVRTDEGRLQLTVLLVDEVASAPPSFDARFAELSPAADVLFYGGHAGLGANVRALTKKMRSFPSKYQLLFLNGCDTFSYEDDTLNAARKLLNPSDASGSKYLDVLRNAMPAYFQSMPNAAAALLDGMLNRASPPSYGEIFAAIDAAQVVLVTGEEDNAFTPAMELGPRWQGLAKAGGVAYDVRLPYQTETLPAGRYVFELTPDPAAPGGDADLYVRVGSAPSLTKPYKCPSYKANSNERCFVSLAAPSQVFMAVRGDKKNTTSAYALRAWQQFD